MAEDDLLLLMQQCKIWNESHGITGMLLYLEGKFLSAYEGRFMQVLEGTEQDVKEIFDQIKLDKRHHSMIILKHTSIQERNFETWSMGFKFLKLYDFQTLPGCFNLNEGFLKSDELQQSSIPLNLLKSFYQINLD